MPHSAEPAVPGSGEGTSRQDTVEAAWRVVDPVLGDVTPVHPYARGTWGAKEADRLLPHRDAWHNPA
jgi:glucose-6-phosphate 1-dehydrogenase